MVKISEYNSTDYTELVEIWERSVRASHGFLDENAIMDIKQALIPDYFPNVSLYVAYDQDRTVGFMGLCDNRIEMLFIDGDQRGRGYGTALITFATGLGATEVDVNEQNPEALKFYRANGFYIKGRSETDEAGRPYPILHLSL